MIKVRVYHSYYGCETGCCGHVIELEDGIKRRSHFEFTHPYGAESIKDWARQQAESVIKSRWPECLDSIDWESINIEDVSDESDEWII